MLSILVSLMFAGFALTYYVHTEILSNHPDTIVDSECPRQPMLYFLIKFTPLYWLVKGIILNDDETIMQMNNKARRFFTHVERLIQSQKSFACLDTEIPAYVNQRWRNPKTRPTWKVLSGDGLENQDAGSSKKLGVIRDKDLIVVELHMQGIGPLNFFDYSKTFHLGVELPKYKLRGKLGVIWERAQKRYTEGDITAQELSNFIVQEAAELGYDVGDKNFGCLVRLREPKNMTEQINEDNMRFMRGRREWMDYRWMLQVHLVDRKNNIQGKLRQMLSRNTW